MIGRIVSHFEIQQKIGVGGMAEVYKARDVRLDRPVALKFLNRPASQDRQAQTRLLEEARAVSKLDHRNICTIYEIAQTDDGTQFIAMAFYEGQTLARVIKRTRLPVVRALEIAARVADGLDAAHRHQIVHRDVKPSNIMITPEGELKILDFGIARLMREDAERQKAYGTLAYMAPERVRGAEGDERSDIWSLGVVLYTMLADTGPFRAEGSQEMADAILYSEPEPITLRRPSEARAIQRILDRTLTKHPNGRYHTAEEMHSDIRQAVAEVAGNDGDGWSSKPAMTQPVRIPGIDRPETHEDKTSEHSIAVLPLKDLSPDQDQEYFCSGMTEELIFLLTRVPGLRVASRESAYRLLGEKENSREVGRRLGVANILEGSIHKSGNRLRVTARLVRISDARYLWSGKYDREIEDLFHIQDQIAKEITAALEVTLIRDPREPRVATSNEKLRAHHLYLKGRFHWNRRDAENLKKAIGYFGRAIDELPSYARPYAGLADSHAMLGVYGALQPSEVMPVAMKAADQALEIDEGLAEVYVSRALVRSHYERDFDQAEVDFRKALELNPYYATAHQQYAMTCLIPKARFDEAFRELQHAQQLDPLSVPICVSMGLCHHFSREYAKAAEEYDRALEIEEDFIRIRVFLAEAYERQGLLDEALVMLLRAEGRPARGPTLLSALGRIYSKLKYHDRAEHILNQLLELSTQRYVTPTLIAQLYVGLGQKVLAIDALQQAYEQRSADLIWLGVHPVYEPLRAEPEFVRLLQKLGLELG